MRNIKIAILDEKKDTTGGEKYNTSFFSVLQDLKADVSYLGRTTYKNGISLKKIFAPIIELKYLKEVNNFDVLFFSDTLSFRQILLVLIIRVFYRKRCFTILHHFASESKLGWDKVLFHAIESTFFELCSDIVVVSPYMLNLVHKKHKTKKIHYIPIPFEILPYIKDTHIKGKLLYVGTIEERKGLVFLLNALALLKKESNIEFELNIVGKIVSKPYFEVCESIIKSNNMQQKCCFLNRIDKDALDNLYKTSDFFILPSLLEGFGIVIIEAMSYGLPVVAFNNTAIPYTVKTNYNGLLVKNCDEIDLAAKLLTLLKNDCFKKSLRKGALATAKKVHSFADFKGLMGELYESMKK